MAGQIGPSRVRAFQKWIQDKKNMKNGFHLKSLRPTICNDFMHSRILCIVNYSHIFMTIYPYMGLGLFPDWSFPPGLFPFRSFPL